VADQLLTKGRQEGRQEGRVEGRLEGRVEGRLEGRLEGRQEGEIKLIRTLESILGIEPAETDLSEKTLEELQRITESLQDRIQRRG
jgi:predicted transposase YdaD